MTYNVGFTFRAYYDVDVEAESEDSAIEKAKNLFRDSDDTDFMRHTDNFEIESTDARRVDD